MNARGFRGRGGYRPRGFHPNNGGNFANSPPNQRYHGPHFCQQNQVWQGRSPFQQNWPPNRNNQYAQQGQPPQMNQFNNPRGMPNPQNAPQHCAQNFHPSFPLVDNNSDFRQNSFRGRQSAMHQSHPQRPKQDPVSGTEVERQKEMSKTLDLIKESLSTASETEKQSWEKNLSQLQMDKLEDKSILGKDAELQSTSHDSKGEGDARKEEGNKAEGVKTNVKQEHSNIADTGQSKPRQMPVPELLKNQNNQQTGVSAGTNVPNKVESIPTKGKITMTHDKHVRNPPMQMETMKPISDYHYVAPQINNNTFYPQYPSRQLPDLNQQGSNNFQNAQSNMGRRDMPNFTSPYSLTDTKNYYYNNNLQPSPAFDPRIGHLERAKIYGQTSMDVLPMHIPMMPPMPPAGFMPNNPGNYLMPMPTGHCPAPPFMPPTMHMTQPQQEQPMLPPPPPAGSPPPEASLLLGQQSSLDDCLEDGWKDMQEAMAFANQSINMIPESPSLGKKKRKKKKKTNAVVADLMIAMPDEPANPASSSNVQKIEAVEKQKVAFNFPTPALIPRQMSLKQQLDESKRRSMIEESKSGKSKESPEKLAPKELASSTVSQKAVTLQSKTPAVVSEIHKEPATIPQKNTVRVNPIKVRKSPKSPLDEARWKDDIVNRFKEMNRDGISKIINNECRKKYEIPMKRLVQETRSSLSLEMRNSQDEKVQVYGNLPEEFMSALQAMLDLNAMVDIDINNLPTNFVQNLNEFLEISGMSILNTEQTESTEVEESGKKSVAENIVVPKNQTYNEKNEESPQILKNSKKSSQEAPKQLKHDVVVPNFPVAKSGQPVSKSGQPVSKTGQPVSKTGQPISKSGQSVSKTGQPLSKSGQPVSTVTQEVTKTVQPVSKSGKSVSKSGQPVLKSGQPVSTVTQEVTKTGQPVSKSGQAVTKTGQPTAKSFKREFEDAKKKPPKIAAAPQLKEQQKVVAPSTALELSKHQAIPSSVDLPESCPNPTSEKSEHHEKIVASALDDLFPGGLLKNRAPVQLSSQNKVSTSHSSKSSSITINKTHADSDSRKDPIMAKYEKSQVDVDDIFSAGIAKAKFAKNSSATERKTKEEPKISQPESEAMCFRNLTKEEWDAKHGKYPSHKQRHPNSDGRNRSASPSGYDHVSMEKKPAKSNEDSNNSAERQKRNALTEDESSDSDSSSDDSSGGSGSNSDTSSNDKCLRLLKIIKESESIAKNKSLSETIRDEVTAEIERKRKEQGKKKKKKKAKKYWKKKYSMFEKKKSSKKSKKSFSPETKKNESNTNKVCKTLTGNEIKKGTVDEPVPETVVKSSTVPVSKGAQIVSKIKTPSNSIADSNVHEETACESSKLDKSSKPKVNANNKTVTFSQNVFSASTGKNLKNAVQSKSIDDEQKKFKNVPSNQKSNKIVKGDKPNKIVDSVINGSEFIDQNTKQLDARSLNNEKTSSIAENPTLLTQDLLCIPILKRSIDNLPKESASDSVTSKKSAVRLNRTCWSDFSKNSKKDAFESIDLTQSMEDISTKVDEATDEKSENENVGQNIDEVDSSFKGKEEEHAKDGAFGSASDILNENTDTKLKMLVEKENTLGHTGKFKEVQTFIEAEKLNACQDGAFPSSLMTTREPDETEDVPKEKCDVDAEKVGEVNEKTVPWENVGFDESWKNVELASTPDVAKNFPEDYKNPSPEGYVEPDVAKEVQPETLQHPTKDKDGIIEDSAKKGEDDIPENDLEASTNGALMDIIGNSEMIEMDAPLLDEIARVSLTTLEKNDSMMPDDVNFNGPLQLLGNCKEFDLSILELEEIEKKNHACNVVYDDSINCNSLRIDDPSLKTNLKEDEEMINMSLRSVPSPFKCFPPESISGSPYLQKPFFNLDMDELSYDGAIDTSNVNIDDNLGLVENVDPALLTPLLMDSLKILSNNDENSLVPEFFEGVNSKPTQKSDEKTVEKKDSEVEIIVIPEPNQTKVSSSNALDCSNTNEVIPVFQKLSSGIKSTKPTGEMKSHSKKTSKDVKTDKVNDCSDVKKDKSIKKDSLSKTRIAATRSASPSMKNQVNEQLLPLFTPVDSIQFKSKNKSSPSIAAKVQEKKTTKKQLPKEQESRKVTKKNQSEKDTKENPAEVTTVEELNVSSSDRKNVPISPIIPEKKIKDEILQVIQQAPVVVLEKVKDLDDLAKDKGNELESSTKKDSQRSKKDQALHKVKKKPKKEKKLRISEKEITEAIAENIVTVLEPNTREQALKRMIEIDMEIHKLVSEKLSLYELLQGGTLLNQTESVATETENTSDIPQKTDDIEENRDTDSSVAKNLSSIKVDVKEEKSEDEDRNESKKNASPESQKRKKNPFFSSERSSRKRHSSQKREKEATDVEESTSKKSVDKKDKEIGDSEEHPSKKTSHHKKVDKDSSSKTVDTPRTRDKRKSRSKSKSHEAPSVSTVDTLPSSDKRKSRSKSKSCDAPIVSLVDAGTECAVKAEKKVEKTEPKAPKVPASNARKDKDGSKKHKKAQKAKDAVEEKKNAHKVTGSEVDVVVLEDSPPSKSSSKKSKVQENSSRKRLKIYSDDSSSSDLEIPKKSKRPSGLTLLAESLKEANKHKNQVNKKKRKRVIDSSDEDSDVVLVKVPYIEKKQSKSRNDSSKKKTTKEVVDNDTVNKHIDEAIDAAISVGSLDAEDFPKEVDVPDVPDPVSSPMPPHDIEKMEEDAEIAELNKKQETEEDKTDEKLHENNEVVSDIFLSNDSRGSGDNAVDFNLHSVKKHKSQIIDLTSNAEKEADDLGDGKNIANDVEDVMVIRVDDEGDKTNDSSKTNEVNEKPKNRKATVARDEVSDSSLSNVAHDQNSNFSTHSSSSSRSHSKKKRKHKEKSIEPAQKNLAPEIIDLSDSPVAKKRKRVFAKIKGCEVQLVDMKYTFLCPRTNMRYFKEAGISWINNWPRHLKIPNVRSRSRSRPTSANKNPMSCIQEEDEASQKEEIQPEVPSTSTHEENEKIFMARLGTPSPMLRSSKEIKKSAKVTQYASHMGPILHIQVFEDSFLAASEDGNIYRYCLSQEKLLNTYEGHTDAVTCLCIPSVVPNSDFSKSWVYSGSLDGTLRCFDIQSGAQIHNVAAIKSSIQCMDLGWGTLYLGTKSGHIARYKTKNGTIKDEEFSYVNKPVLALKTTNEGQRRVLVVAARNQPITIRDARTGLFLRSISGQTHYTVYSLLRDHGHIFCGTSTTSIPVFDFITGEEKFQFNAGVGIVCMCLYEQLLFAGCYDGNIYVFDLKKKDLVCTMAGPGNMLLSMEVVNRKVIAGSKDKNLHLWDMPEAILKALDCES